MKYEATSIAEYLEKVSQINKTFCQPNEAVLFYRGQTRRGKTTNEKYTPFDPEPSVFREGRSDKEDKIYAKVMTECAHEFAMCVSHCEILAKMQHYGVPTRLLDITTNALSALFFSRVEENGIVNSNDKGVVFIIRTNPSRIKDFDSDTITILSSLPRFSCKDRLEIKGRAEKAENEETLKEKIDFFHKDGESEAVRRLLHEIRKEKPAFAPLIRPNDVLSSFIFTPQKTNPRIIRQNGAFVIFGLGSQKLESVDDISETKYKNPDIVAEISIRKKGRIQNELEQCGISLATMYPELYKFADYIKAGKIT